ncbi:MAG: electron transport complex subunit RsxE [Bacilli bacterium]|nr:electron transport complex subunit RsxE [Bacilli bacterium]
MEAIKKSTIFKDGVIGANPVLVSLLGLCPALAITTSIDNAIGMTFAVLIVLLLSNVSISLLRKIIPDEIRIPVFIILIASFTSCVDFLMHAFTPTLYDSLGVFIPLIVVNCLILGRAEAFASKNTVGNSIIDAIGMALGYGLALFIISFVREVLTSQSLTLSNPFNTNQSVTLHLIDSIKISLFGESSGAFIALALVIAVITAIKLHKEDKKSALASKQGDK